MKKIFAAAAAFMLMLTGCQNDLPSGGDTFSGFEGYTQELTEQELENAMKSGKVELENRPEENICYVSITCKTAIASGELSDSMLSVLPEDGVVLLEYKTDFEEGDTVFDVVAKVVKENKIHMEHTGTAKVPYIEGVANLYEFDCGPLSGWMYQVNGWFPSFSMGQFDVEPGDHIEIIYTCDLGDDVGDTYGD
ncbi:MAG: DUF4430 domain-containing protein [Oscillospiraceae bacterium]|nr:DUF4430 domain-containing protein [Oscillospiraceae bacterium]MBQ4117504.1 DUF4430 domain-containing protein [Oscillospiraceae bacterium]MBQ6801843.1 DUF4430 domain-containing protein [Oscillospiraceae bacterium]